MTDVIPLIYTSKGNVPIDSLKQEVEWGIDVPRQCIKFVERYRDSDGEIVKESAHVYALQGVNALAEVGRF